ncbi:hypothetical protein E2C01_083702 [Portunus trituberculatus]|uniref:Uncharacterized protein n=1 Tax=Portunus trituberculatus TaxID=210409 RepID=A0A5B7IT52_PORTR|nr:hypothetical protein [Portunus trituberculatus]
MRVGSPSRPCKDFPRVDAQRCFVLLWVSSMNANHRPTADTWSTLVRHGFVRSTGVLDVHAKTLAKKPREAA